MAKREDNLKPFTSEQSREEAAKNGSKGGIASGEARRRKRDLKLAMQALLETEIKSRDGRVLSGAEAIAAKQFEKALKGDDKAFRIIGEYSGQKPVEKVEQVNIDGEYLDKVNELKAFFNGEEEQRDNTTDKEQSK